MAKRNPFTKMLFGGEREDDRDEIYEDEEFENDDEYYENEEEEASEEPVKRTARFSRRSSVTSDKVVNISTTAQLQVVVVKPEKLSEVFEIAAHLMDKRTVAVNFENTGKDVRRRMKDFLSGVTHANNGKVTKIDNNVYLMTPYNVGLMGDDIIDELEHSGMSFE